MGGANIKCQGANVSFYMGVAVKAGYTFLFAFY